MSIVTIKEVKGAVECAADGTAEHVFNVKNATDQTLEFNMQIAATDPTDKNWITIDGAAGRTLDTDTMTQVTVKIAVPSDCPSGQYGYRLRVFDPKSPGERFTDGETVFFNVPPKKDEEGPPKKSEPKKKKSWIPIAIAAGVVLVVGIVVAVIFTGGQKEEVKVPSLINNDIVSALQKIDRQGLSFDSATGLHTMTTASNTKFNKVLKQEPKPNQMVAQKTAVQLWVGVPPKQPFFKIIPPNQMKILNQLNNIKVKRGITSRDIAPAKEQ